MEPSTRHFVSSSRTFRKDVPYLEPDRYRTLDQAFARSEHLAVMGAGLSYVGASFGGGATSISTRHFDRIIDFDPQAAIVEVEAGISLGKLYNFLIEHGYMLPIQPGHPQITVGGCIAGNVHGKNQVREGLFMNGVESLQLFHPDRGRLRASRDENAEVFALTCGGFGLTGLIETARLRIARLPSGTVRVTLAEFSTLAEGFERIDALKDEADMVYAWVDLARQNRWGHGIVVCAKSEPENGKSAEPVRWSRMDPSARSLRRKPVLSPVTMPTVNAFYEWSSLRTDGTSIPLFQFLFPSVGKEYYYDLFGERGFIEMQVLIPSEALDGYLQGFQELMRSGGSSIALATIKAFDGDDRLLDYTGRGFSFSFDMFNNSLVQERLSSLDALNTTFGAKTNLLKDGRISADVARQQYPGIAAFKDALHGFDPRRRFRSELSERLQL